MRDFDEALRRSPGSAACLTDRGNLRRTLATWRLDHGEDPGSLLADAAADLGESLRLNPNQPEVRKGLEEIRGRSRGK